MDAYLKDGLPEEYRSMISSRNNGNSKVDRMEYINQVSDDWNSSSSNHKPSLKISAGTLIHLLLVDESDSVHDYAAWKRWKKNARRIIMILFSRMVQMQFVRTFQLAVHSSNKNNTACFHSLHSDQTHLDTWIQ